MSRNVTVKPLVHFSSLLCVIHCVLAPFLISFSPFLGSFFESNIVKFALLFVSILCGVWVVYNGYCTHKKRHAITLFIFGAALWVVQTLLEYFHIHTTEIYLYVGTGLVLVSYFINHKYLNCCPAECCNL